jgi:phosphatidate cytidylyltransferase
VSEAPAPKKASNLVVRLSTAAVAAPVILYLLFWAPPWGFQILVMSAVAIAAFELFGMTMGKDRVLEGYGILASLAVATVVLFFPSPPVLVATFALLPMAGLLFALVRPDPIDRADRRMAWMIAGPLYVGLLATIGRLHMRDNGGGWVVLTMMLAWFGDTGGYFAGRAFGKHKLYEKVSPKKTIEGSVGGLAGSVLGALLAHFWYLQALPLVGGVLLALVAGALGQAGDLSESLIKRSAGVKDSGVIVPGHGGLLDRVDALVFTGAATWLYATLILDAR